MSAHRRHARRQKPTSPGRAEAAGATPGPGRLPVAERVRVTEGRSAETESSNSRGHHRPFLLQEVGGEKVRRAGGARARGAGKRVLPWRHLAGPPSPPKALCARLSAGRRSPFLQRTKAALGSGGGGGGQAPGSRLPARALSHPRSETRLRRALSSPARRAAPT